MRKPRLGPVAAIYHHDLKEANETIRELRFKVQAYGVLCEFALANLPQDARSCLGNGLFRLALGHIRGEHPLSWSFQDRTVRVE
jgi:hypothetical protein